MEWVYICISFMRQTLKLPITSVKEFGKLILNAYTLYDFFFHRKWCGFCWTFIFSSSTKEVHSTSLSWYVKQDGDESEVT